MNDVLTITPSRPIQEDVWREFAVLAGYRYCRLEEDGGCVDPLYVVYSVNKGVAQVFTHHLGMKVLHITWG